jgi:hypothetical protein
MLKFSFQIIMGCVICLFGISHSLTRPQTPTVTNPTFDGTHISFTVGNTDGDEYHAALLTDLTAALQVSYESGSQSVPLEGACVSYSIKKGTSATETMSLPVGDQTIERYFVAVAASKKDSNGVKVYSGWRVYTDANGLPISLSTSQGDKKETVFYRARKISERNDSLVVIDFKFSLPTADASDYSFTLKRDATTIVTFSDLGSITDTVNNITSALVNSSRINNNTLVIMREENNFYLYNIYTILSDYGINPDDRLNGQLIKNTGEVDTAIAHIGIYGDSSYQNMISTIYDLLRVANTVPNPIYPGVLQALPSSDTLKAKLLITAMLDLSLPHNSPAPNSNEAAGGIFTNYIQCMDNIVRNWSTIRSGGIGLPRLRNIHANILATNKDSVIIDPIYVKNYGTLAEYGQQKEAQKRKNYAFYEGYSRLNVDLAVPTASGLMFRISPNIQLYEANLADTFNMFDTAFISGGPASRRIIIPSNDSLLLKFQTDGIWLKGDSTNSSEKNYYCGMEAVRLKMQSGGDSIGVPFSVGGEGEVQGDVVGSIVGGVNSILKSKVLYSNDKGTVDTIVSKYNGVLLHGEHRWVEYDSNYVKESQVKFTCREEDTSIIELQSFGIGVHVIDKAHDEAVVFGKKNKLINGKEKTVEVVEYKADAGSLLFKNAVNRNANVIIEGNATGITPIETDPAKRILKGKIDGKLIVKVSQGVEIYIGNTTIVKKVFPRKQILVAGQQMDIKSEKLDWDEFNEIFHPNPAFTNLFIKSQKGGIQEFSVQPEQDPSKVEVLKIYAIKVKEKGITWYRQETTTWTKDDEILQYSIGTNSTNTIRLAIEYCSGIPDKILEKNLNIKLQLLAGRNQSYPEIITNTPLVTNGVVSSGVRVKIENDIVKIWNIDANEIIRNNVNISDGSRFAMDNIFDDFQNEEDSDAFCRLLIGGSQHYVNGKARNGENLENCFSRMFESAYSGGHVFFKIEPYSDVNIGNDKKFIYPYRAKWILFSGHNSTGKAGFNLGLTPATSFKLCEDYNRIIEWNGIGLIVFNTCYAVGCKELENNKYPADVNPTSKTSQNYGLQWFEATRGAIVLGYGLCRVDGILYGAKAEGKSPPDCLGGGGCNGSNSLTAKIMEKFFVEISGLSDATLIAQKWVEACTYRYGPSYHPNQLNAIGIGAKSVGNGKIQVELYAYNPTTNKVDRVWWAERVNF